LSETVEKIAFELPSALLARRSELFLVKYKDCNNAFRKFLSFYLKLLR